MWGRRERGASDCSSSGCFLRSGNNSTTKDIEGEHILEIKLERCVLLFAQFDRSGRTKSESLSGLEEVLTCLQPSTFFDDQLSRYRGFCWTDFLSSVQQQRPFNKATKSTLTSTTEEATTPGGSTAIHQFPTTAATPPPRNVLVRQATQQDYSSRIKVLVFFFFFDSAVPAAVDTRHPAPLMAYAFSSVVFNATLRLGVDPREEGSIRIGTNHERALPRP